MRRTKFYNKVLNLVTERKHRRLLQRKAEREFLQNSAETPNDYRIGLMVCLDLIKLQPKDQALCEKLAALPAGDSATLRDMMALSDLIDKLIKNPRAVAFYRERLDEIDDGGSKLLRKVG